MLIFRAWATCGLSVKFVFSLTIAYVGSRYKRKSEEYNSLRGFTNREQTRKRGSQWGGGFYSYRLRFWLFYGYRLMTKKLKINFFSFKELNINKPAFYASSKQN